MKVMDRYIDIDLSRSLSFSFYLSLTHISLAYSDIPSLIQTLIKSLTAFLTVCSPVCLSALLTVSLSSSHHEFGQDPNKREVRRI